MVRTSDPKFECECGGKYLDSNKRKHENTKMHRKWAGEIIDPVQKL